MKQLIFKGKVKSVLSIVLFGISQELFAASGENQPSDDSALLLILIVFIAVLAAVIGILSSVIRSIANNKEMWKNRFEKSAIIAMLIGFFTILPEKASAHTMVNYIMSSEIFYILTGTIILLFLITLFLNRILKGLLNDLKDGEEVEEEVSFISQLTDAVPIEREEEVLTDHEYDGIRELDNVLPPWWVYLFYATIIFSFVYMFRYHVFGSGNVMAEEYQTQIEEAKKIQDALAESNPGMSITEENVERLLTSADLERGKVIFNANCATCHLETGGGDNGPNLTDQYWIHGGDIKDIFKTIKYGVTGKMIAWETMIKPDDMQRVASYVMSLQGSNPPNGKAPQGELYAIDNVDASSSQSPADTTTMEQ